MMPPFFIGESLRFGWRTMRLHNSLLLKVVLTLVGLALLRGLFQALVQNAPANIALAILITIIELIFGIGATVISLRLARGEPASYRDIIPSVSTGIRYILASIAAGVIVLLGFLIPILLGSAALYLPAPFSSVVGGFLVAVGIILGVYLILRYSMVKFGAVDGVHRIGEILRQSTHITRGVKWRLLGFLIVIICLNILGAVALIVGLLVTIPVSMLAAAHVYLKLLERAG
ncbi:MAG: hypothetical protein KGJ34_00540 [Patescibacteria group bacterium]|nr:hypothetical protein [Patescibacteria group bacterium]